MEITVFADLITTLGFPIALVAVLLWFIFKLQQESVIREETIRNDAKTREEQLYKVITAFEEKLNDVAMTLVKVNDTLSLLTERVVGMENKIEKEL